MGVSSKNRKNRNGGMTMAYLVDSLNSELDLKDDIPRSARSSRSRRNGSDRNSSASVQGGLADNLAVTCEGLVMKTMMVSCAAVELVTMLYDSQTVDRY